MSKESNTVMSLEQFEEFAKTLPEDADKRRVARALGLKLPVVILPMSEQLAAASVVEHELKATKNRAASKRNYVQVPALKIDEQTSTRPVMINARVARAVFERGLALCDENNL